METSWLAYLDPYLKLFSPWTGSGTLASFLSLYNPVILAMLLSWLPGLFLASCSLFSPLLTWRVLSEGQVHSGLSQMASACALPSIIIKNLSPSGAVTSSFSFFVSPVNLEEGETVFQTLSFAIVCSLGTQNHQMRNWPSFLEEVL